jgi:acyl carrier protein
MTLQDAFRLCPDIKKITLVDLNKVARKIKSDKSFQIDMTKTFYEQGFDELNCVEMIMELENNLDIHIYDEVASFIITENSKPDFTLQEWRERQINKIIND